jgi:sulfate transport system substrate-binding protein
MSIRTRRGLGAILALTLTAALAACSGNSSDSAAGTDGQCTPADLPTINLAAYSTARGVYGALIPAFQTIWKDAHDGQQVKFLESYDGSTTQSQNVINGFPADIVALSLAPDVTAIQDAGLITSDWTSDQNSGGADAGMVSSSVVAFDVRPGNPLGITDYSDLTKPGVEVLTPDPAQSGGARWNLVSAYGAAMRGFTGNTKDDETGADNLLKGIIGNVKAFDKSAHASVQNFEAGVGDVAITYENEILTAQDVGLPDEGVYPESTVQIQNPVAIVDKNVDDHCVRPIAEAFVQFLHSKDAKAIYAKNGFLRPVDLASAQKGGPGMPAIKDLWTVDELGGWDALTEKLFSDTGVATQAIASQG